MRQAIRFDNKIRDQINVKKMVKVRSDIVKHILAFDQIILQKHQVSLKKKPVTFRHVFVKWINMEEKKKVTQAMMYFTKSIQMSFIAYIMQPNGMEKELGQYAMRFRCK